MFQSPGEVAFNIFGFPVYFYGIIMAIAIFTGFLCAYFLYRKYYGNPEKIVDFSPYLIIIGIFAARIYYCALNFTYYSHNPLEIFDIRQGGLSVHGMLAAGIISLFIFSKHYKMEFLKLTDVFLCATPLAQSIGRWGNFFNSEAFGIPSDLPWKLYIPPSHRPLEYMNFEYFHPAFLYESILDLIIFIILICLFKRFSKNSGVISCLYLILYSIVRIFVEQIRIDSALNLAEMPVAQIVSGVIFAAAAICLRILCKKKPDVHQVKNL